jgi:hypothetical protein
VFMVVYVGICWFMLSVDRCFRHFRSFSTFSQSGIYFIFSFSREINPRKRLEHLKRLSYHTKSCKTPMKLLQTPM